MSIRYASSAVAWIIASVAHAELYRLRLVEETLRVAPRQQYSIDFRLPEPATVECEVDVTRGPVVQLSLYQERRLLAIKGPFRQGRMAYPAARAGSYRIVLDPSGDGKRAAELRLRVSAILPVVEPAYPTPARRRAAILSSLLFAVATAAFAGIKIRRAWRQRR